MKITNECYLNEIYSAIQGEGPLVGVRQLFIRFSACDLRCIWCDTPDSLVRTEYCQVEENNGTRIFNKMKNPISSSQLISIINRLEPKLHQSVSLTGGEPLLQSNFLLSFLPVFKKTFSLPIYLESGGHRPNELKKIINLLDYISMDFKLPSSARVEKYWDEHLEFLSISLNAKKNLWVKIVLTSDTLIDELIYSVSVIKDITKNNNVEIFLQPVSAVNGSKPPNEYDILHIHSKLLTIYPYIRVLPQVHKLIGQK